MQEPSPSPHFTNNYVPYDEGPVFESTVDGMVELIADKHGVLVQADLQTRVSRVRKGCLSRSHSACSQKAGVRVPEVWLRRAIF